MADHWVALRVVVSEYPKAYGLAVWKVVLKELKWDDLKVVQLVE